MLAGMGVRSLTRSSPLWRRPPATLLALARAPMVAETLVAAFTLAIYREGLWSVPRWDHLIFLYEASQFGTAGELIAHAPAWNRSVSIGDHAEFRPLFHLLLVTEQLLFGRSYWLWQAVGMALHAAQAVLVLRVGRRAFPGALWPPVLLAALFASLLLGAETVIWFHANAYILCTVLLTGSLERLLAYLDTGRRAAGSASLLLALTAAFTYELGAFYSLMVGALLAISALPRPGQRAGGAAGIPSSRRARLLMSGGHGAIAATYLAISVVDLLRRFPGLEGSDARLPGPEAFVLGGRYAVQQIGVWLGGMVFPSLYDIVPGSRAFLAGVMAPAGPAFAVNAVAVLLLFTGGVGLLATRRPLRAAAPGVLAGLAVLGGYSWLVALGRSVPRGLSYTLQQNLQHAYPALLSVVLTIAVAGWTWRRTGGGHPAPEPRGTVWTTLLGVGAVGLIAANVVATTTLLAEFRHSYVAPKLELLHHAERWHALPSRPAYFRVSADCPGHDPLPWFGPYVRHQTELVYFIDVIFPETSFNLHRARVPAATPVGEISCAAGVVDARGIVGAWRELGRVAEVRAGPAGHLEAVNPAGSRSPLVLRGRTVTAPAWRAEGLVSHDGRHIFWRGAVPWYR